MDTQGLVAGGPAGAGTLGRDTGGSKIRSTSISDGCARSAPAQVQLGALETVARLIAGEASGDARVAGHRGPERGWVAECGDAWRPSDCRDSQTQVWAAATAASLGIGAV